MPSKKELACECGHCQTCLWKEEIWKEAQYRVDIRAFRKAYLPKWIEDITEKLALLKIE